MSNLWLAVGEVILRPAKPEGSQTHPRAGYSGVACSAYHRVSKIPLYFVGGLLIAGESTASFPSPGAELANF
jgi:hypothetical protein